MTETKCFRDAFRDQLHEFSGQANTWEKNFPFLPVSFLFEIYLEKRKFFRMYNSIMRIESVVVSFWMALSVLCSDVY